MDTVETFVNSLIMATTEGREPMTYDDAFIAISEWIKEGWELPKDLTARKLADLWNEGIKENGGSKTMLKPGDFIKVHIFDVTAARTGEIKTNNYGQTFEIVPDPFGAPGIWWNGEENGDGLHLLVSFAWNVVFEDVKTGELYHVNGPTGGIVPLDRVNYPYLIPC